MTEVLPKEKYGEYEQFCQNHPCGSFTQSTRWFDVKYNWGGEVLVVRDNEGNIAAGCVVLIKKLPVLGVSLLYTPRGPVCDYENKALLEELKTGLDGLAKTYRAYQLKWDPEITAEHPGNENFKEMGFSRFYGPAGLETIQARFNYRLFLQGRNEDELFAAITQKTRYNIRVAIKHGVQVRPVGLEHLDDFMRLMQVTGARDGFVIRPKAYFERMFAALGEHARLYMGFYEEKAVCGAVCINFAGQTTYLYGASDNEYRNVMPNYLMQWEMIRWAVETGCYVYDFLGVSGVMDKDDPMYGLYRFKKGFNGQLDEYVGEWNYNYKPFVAKLVDMGMALREKRRQLVENKKKRERAAEKEKYKKEQSADDVG